VNAYHTGTPGAGNDTSVVNTAIATGKPVVFLGGTWNLQSVVPNPDQWIIGMGGATVSPYADASIFEAAQGARVTGLTAVGSGKASGNLNEIFVRISGEGEVFVDFCNVSAMGGAGVLVREFYSTYDGSNITNNRFSDSLVGVNLENRGEYCGISSNIIKTCATGIIVKGGNNKINSNTISANTLGLHVAAGDNDAHGIVGHNTINHNTINVQVDAVNVEEMAFEGNSIYAGKIVLDGCEGVSFRGGIVESSTLIEEKGATECVFRGVKFPGGINNTPNDGSPSKVLYVDCDMDRTSATSTADSINGSYSEVDRASGTTLAAAGSTYAVFTTKNFNSITANASFTVENLYSTGTYIWDPTLAVVERGFSLSVNMQISIARVAATVDTANIHALLVDAVDDNIILGVFVPSPERILAGDTRTHTYVFAGEIERRAFRVKLINNSANTITLMSDQATARTRAIVTKW